MSEIIIQNRMVGRFQVIHENTSDLSCNLRPIFPDSSELRCLIKIPPNNRMAGRFDVKAPPRITVKLNPIQDAFVREFVPTLNYGTTSDLYVGRSLDGERFRSFIQFSLDQLPQNLYLTKAKLTLYIANTDTEFSDFELSIADRRWDEEGITWAGQPARSKILKVVSINKGTSKIEFDVLDIVKKWYNGTYTNYGFLLKAFDESVTQLKRLYSKETANYKPTLEIEYFDPYVYSYGKSEIQANLTVRAQKYKNLTASMVVQTYYGHSGIHGTLHVHNQDMIECFVTVSHGILPFTMTIRQSNDLPVTFRPKFKNYSEVIARLYPNHKILPGIITVRQEKEEFLNAVLTVRQSKEKILNAQLSVQIPHIVASLDVRHLEDITGALYVKALGYSELSYNINVCRRAIFANMVVRNSNDLQSTLHVRKAREEFLQSTLTVSHRFISCHLDIVQLNDLPTILTVRKSDYSELDGNIIIRQHDESDITALIQTRATATLPSRIFVLSPYMRAKIRVRRSGYKQIVAYGQVRQNSEINSTILVRRYLNLTGKFRVRVRWFGDLTCRFRIGGEIKKRAYAFIL